MTRIMVISETLPLSSVKSHLSELVDRVEDQHDRVVVTRNGKPAAVLISPDDLESLEETLAILSDPAAMDQIRESERSLVAAAKGRNSLRERRRTKKRRARWLSAFSGNPCGRFFRFGTESSPRGTLFITILSLAKSVTPCRNACC